MMQTLRLKEVPGEKSFLDWVHFPPNVSVEQRAEKWTM